MSKLLDNFRITKQHDKRIKLTDAQRQEIKDLYKQGLAIRAIARLFDGICSRRLIMFIIHPERLELMQAKHKAEKHHMTYYNTEKRRAYMRTHRAHKRELINNQCHKNCGTQHD